jgi:hypothetical protein
MGLAPPARPASLGQPPSRGGGGVPKIRLYIQERGNLLINLKISSYVLPLYTTLAFRICQYHIDQFSLLTMGISSRKGSQLP